MTGLQRTLVLLIDQQDAERIRTAQQRVTLARPMNGVDPSVVWLAIDPVPTITVAWREENGLYASASPAVAGQSLVKMAETPIPTLPGAAYSYTSSGFVGPSSGGVPAGSFRLANQVPYEQYPMLTFGLTQSATVNGMEQRAKPQSALAVLATQSATLTPQPVVFVWLQAQLGSEVVINSVQGSFSKVSFAGEEQVTLRYDPRLGLFVPVASTTTAARVDLVMMAFS